MPKVRVNCFAVSLDGFGAGPEQSLENPMGVGGMGLHRWAFATPSFGGDGEPGPDDAFIKRGMSGMGAWILGRNMFGPVRGSWLDDDWKGWWGDNPPYHCDVFVLTNHPRPSFEMEGGTVFHFVTDGIHAALDRAKAAAGEKDIRIGGGTATIHQYLRAGLIDEMHIAVSPVLLGRGEAFFAGIDLPACGLTQIEHVAGTGAEHYLISRG
jgi:dihydrofolate reductase